MKQYCRYCVWLCVNNVPYCDKKQKFRSESSCMHTNKCNDFRFANCDPEYQDAFGITNGYRPRKPKKKQQCEGQMKLDL